MGFDVYSYIMVGVQANKVIEKKETTFQQTYYNERTGQPYKRLATVSTYVVGDKEFDQVDSDIDGYFNENGLSLICFDGLGFDEDTIGLIVCDMSNEGGRKLACTIEELQTKLKEVKELLWLIGIKEEPEVRLVMMLSY